MVFRETGYMIVTEDDLRSRMCINDKYKQLYDFKKWVIQSSLDEIEKKTGIKVTCKVKKNNANKNVFVFTFTPIKYDWQTVRKMAEGTSFSSENIIPIQVESTEKLTFEQKRIAKKLTDNGVEEPVALNLVRKYAAGRLIANIEKVLNKKNKMSAIPGGLVAAITQNWVEQDQR